MAELTRAFFQRAGMKGGLARAAKLSKKARREAARKAAQARWAKWRKEQGR